MKILITGASGLVGQQALLAALERGHKVWALGHERAPVIPPEAGARKKAVALPCDLLEADKIERLAFDFYPDAIINAAAFSNPAAVDANPAAAERLNVALPRRLAELAFHLSARLLHLSSDYVFDGEGGPYRSTDEPRPRTLYGQQKLQAEKEVLAHGGNFAVVLRITLVNGNSLSGRRSLHEKLFHAWAAGQVTPLHTDELRQPVSAVNVGAVLVELAERPNLHGLFHWAGPDVLSRYDIGRAVLAHFGLPENLAAPATLAGSPEAATRPRSLEFELAPLLGKLKARPTPFAQQLDELVVPPECLDWYRQNRATPGPAPRRLVQGRDF